MTPRETRLDFEGLYRRHRQDVYRAALRKLGDHHEAEDVTQTTFLDAYRAVLRGSHPDLPRPWLLAIAENVRRRRFRTMLRRPREEPLREALPSAEPPWRAQTEEIRAALSTLAESQRKAFLLRELGGFSYDEIAVQLDTSVPAVQMLLFRARQKLRRELDHSGTARLGGLIPIPHWLIGIADRVPAGAATPRFAGIVAAGAIAAGVGVTSGTSIAEPDRSPAAAAGREEAVVVRAPAIRVPQRTPRLSQRTVATRPAAKPKPAAARGVQATRTRRSPAATPAISPAATPAISPAATPARGGAEPVAPVAPPATLGIDDRAPAPALVLALPPVSQAPTVPVVKVPLLPPLPELPGDESVPALPAIPVEQPPLPIQQPTLPTLPSGVEATIPAVTIPLADP